MRKIFRALILIVAILVLLIIAVGAYLKLMLPNVGAATNLKVEITPQRVEHGKYLANNVFACIHCHTERDWSKYSGPLKQDSLGAGSTLYGRAIGLPGDFFSKNLTPYHLGSWTDGEIFRAITTGVSKDGHALFPLMPYKDYGKLDKEDIYDVIAYLRSLPSIKRDVPPSQPDFPINFIINTMPQKAAFIAKPSVTNSAEYGRYLVVAAGCKECHSQVDDKGQLIAGKEFSGGRQFNVFNFTVNSANLTPDQTGLNNLTKNAFISRFKMCKTPGYTPPSVTENDYNTVMPWIVFADMHDEDLGAIYDYLRTLKPINNKVIKFAKNKNL